MTTIGEIDVVHKRFSKDLKIQWKIKEFSKLSEDGYSSDVFYFVNSSWCLRVYPNGNKHDTTYRDGHISVYLRIKSSAHQTDQSLPKELQFSFSLKTVNKKKVFESHNTRVFAKPDTGEGNGNFLLRSELLERKSELMPCDILTVICILECPKSIEGAFGTKDNKDETSSESELSSDEEDEAMKYVSNKIKGIRILSENLKQMLLDGRMSDAILKVDGKEFKVHKFILVARSPVFASMFQLDLAEKNTSEVDIPDCSAESFEVFLQYLYSGSVETLSINNVQNVYYAADKYQIDDLRKKCAKFMIKNITVETVCDVIALSLRHGESKLQKSATDFYCQNIKAIVKTVEWIKYLEANVTQANELLIKVLNA